MKKKWIIIGVALLIVIFVGANVLMQQNESKASSVETVNLENQKIEESVMVPGELKLANKQTVYPQPDKGEVKEILVDKGDNVEKGDALIRYQNQQLVNQKKQNELQLESQRTELKNIQNQKQNINDKLNDNEGSEQLESKLDDLKMQERQQNLKIKQTKLEKESIEQDIADSTVTSDVDGSVVSIDKEAVSASQSKGQKPIMQIGSLKHMIVEGNISEYDTLKVEKEQSVTLTSEVVPDKSWKGEVSFISDLPEEAPEMKSNEGGATYAVETKVGDDNIDLKPGIKMLMEIQTDEKKAQVVPITAVDRDDDTDYVYTIENGSAKRQEITTGTTSEDVIEITDGLDDENAVIVANPDDVEAGMDVSAK